MKLTPNLFAGGLAVVGFAISSATLLVYLYANYSAMKVTFGVGIAMLVAAVILSACDEANMRANETDGEYDGDGSEDAVR